MVSMSEKDLHKWWDTSTSNWKRLQEVIIKKMLFYAGGVETTNSLQPYVYIYIYIYMYIIIYINTLR